MEALRYDNLRPSNWVLQLFVQAAQTTTWEIEVCLQLAQAYAEMLQHIVAHSKHLALSVCPWRMGDPVLFEN